jgi:hypothetical protein
MRKWSVGFVAVLLGCLTGLRLAAAQSSNAFSINWQEPVRLSAAGNSSWFSDVVADRSGVTHVVWSSGIVIGAGNVFDVVMYSKSSDGVTWTAPIDIAAIPSKGAVTRPAVLIDGNGRMHLTYRRYNIWYTNAPAQDIRPATLRPTMDVSSEENGYFSEMALDARGRLHLFHTENIFDPGCLGCFHLFHRYSDDGGQTWSEMANIWRQSTGSAKPQVVIDSGDNVYVAVEVGRGGDLGQVPPPANVAFLASYDRGLTWTPPYYFATEPGEEGRTIALGLDGNQTLVAAWVRYALEQPATVRYSLSNDQGRTWSPPQPIPGVTPDSPSPTDGYHMVSDSQGNLHLAFSGRKPAEASTSFSLLLVRWDGSEWSAPQTVVQYANGDVAEWPRLAIGLGNQLHVTWFKRDAANVFDSERGQYQVWYRRGELDLPAIAPSPYATRTPTATVVTVSTGTPIPNDPAQIATSKPALPTAAPPTDIYRENDYLLIAAQSVLPVAALVALVFIFKRLRR